MTHTPQRIAILGGGLAGVTAAWQLAQNGHTDVTIFEAGPRLGGIIETEIRDGFTIECGPEGIVTEKPWARDLALELGLADELIYSKDDQRLNYIFTEGRLNAIPTGMRMMVPTSLDSIDGSTLFTVAARQAYLAEYHNAAELRASSPSEDESIASFVLRHFGQEVLDKVAAPLLSGVFGGDVARLSVRAVMPAFVAMEREHGSLIGALESRTITDRAAGRHPLPVFTTFKSGIGILIHRMLDAIPVDWIKFNTPVLGLERHGYHWLVTTPGNTEAFDTVLVCTPAHVTTRLLAGVDPRMGDLTCMDASSAVVVALGFDTWFELPPGFGFLVPAGEPSKLLACTFVDQKFPHRVPQGSRLVRAFFGGRHALELQHQSDEDITRIAVHELEAILGKLPTPSFSVIRRWPRSLPQYEVGHLTRMAELFTLADQQPGLHLLGNAYRGVGMPDLIREARATVNSLKATADSRG